MLDELPNVAFVSAKNYRYNPYEQHIVSVRSPSSSADLQLALHKRTWIRRAPVGDNHKHLGESAGDESGDRPNSGRAFGQPSIPEIAVLSAEPVEGSQAQALFSERTCAKCATVERSWQEVPSLQSCLQRSSRVRSSRSASRSKATQGDSPNCSQQQVTHSGRLSPVNALRAASRDRLRLKKFILSAIAFSFSWQARQTFPTSETIHHLLLSFSKSSLIIPFGLASGSSWRPVYNRRLYRIG
jgi:hypothetical protein